MHALVNTRISGPLSISAISVVNLAFVQSGASSLPVMGSHLWGTVKKLLLRASLQRPVNDQILLFDKVMNFCTTSIKGITFYVISKDDMASVRERQKERYQLGNTVEGTRSSHHFELQSCSAIRME